jgi:hypothetical protein
MLERVRLIRLRVRGRQHQRARSLGRTERSGYEAVGLSRVS